jgi:two-component sensor histidine kinase
MSKELDRIYSKVSKIAGLETGRLKEDEKLKAILNALEIIEAKSLADKKEKKKTEQKISRILDVITALASLDYSKKAVLTGNKDHIDALALGVNMLGEELQSSTVSLREKEILLKEIHHRVKNNLQIISSLLNLQSGQIKDKEMVERFADSRKRLMTMALIHEQLYGSHDLSRVNFGAYIEKLVYSLYGSQQNSRVNIQVDAKLLHLKIDTAIPCGLIVNELLTNCYKYAFPPGRKTKGNIKMYFGNTPSNELQMIIEDDGVGIPRQIDVSNTNTLGLQLVHLLVEQLNGTIELEKSKGTRFNIMLNSSN